MAQLTGLVQHLKSDPSQFILDIIKYSTSLGRSFLVTVSSVPCAQLSLKHDHIKTLFAKYI